METATISSPSPKQLTAKELIDLSAQDLEFYGRTFLPNTFRQRTPLFHLDIMALLDDREHHFVALEVFRGGAKTSLLRCFASRRIAFGTSHLIAFVGSAQSHAIQSLQWLRNHVERNLQWTQTFGLRPGKVWKDDQLEIYHERLGFSINVLAVGITGKIRGINIDDQRPDLIILDDACDDENVGSKEQREKTETLIMGALAKTLAPESEVPDAKMVMLQTSINRDDTINRCHEDKSWASRKYGCFDDQNESRWPERFPADKLRAAKQAHIERNQLSTWLREMECTAVSPETASFKVEWLQYWDILPERLTTYLAIDPVPPPTERQLALDLHNKDYEALAIVGRSGLDFYLLDIVTMRGHTPEWTLAQFFHLVDKWRPLKAVFDAVAYQRTLKWILEQEMSKRGRFVQLDAAPDDKRAKSHKILQAFSGIASQGRFYVHRSMASFISQFASYPQCSHDDELDVVAMALTAAMNNAFVGDDGLLPGQEEYEPLGNWRYAP